jgi:micrococcal nuclease
VGDSLNDYCPRCGTARVGAFRFCRGCSFDFDTFGTEPSGLPADVSTATVVQSTPVMAFGPGRRFSGRRVLGGGVAILFGLAAIGSLQPASGSPIPPNPTSTPTSRAIVLATATLTATPSPAPEPTFGPTGPTTEASVVRVVDGDTIVVAYGGKEYKLRYIGMDSPETVDPNSPVQWMGAQSTAANAALVDGKTVYLEKDVSEVDPFGRLLRYVWLTDGAAWTLVNLELVRQGVASAKSYPPDVRYDALYAATEADAKVAAVGLWAPTPAPPTPAPTPKPTSVPTAVPFVEPEPEPEPASKCHPSYDPCLPIVGDLNCPDVRALGAAPVDVIGPDDYGLDRDNDGIGCE